MAEAALNHELAGLPTARLYDETIDLVVSVCDNARESCLAFPHPVGRIHLPFHEQHGEALESFIAVLENIRERRVPAVRAALADGDQQGGPR